VNLKSGLMIAMVSTAALAITPTLASEAPQPTAGTGASPAPSSEQPAGMAAPAGLPVPFGHQMLAEQLDSAHRQRLMMEDQMRLMMAATMRNTEAMRAYRPAPPTRETDGDGRDAYRDQMVETQRHRIGELARGLRNPFLPQISGIQDRVYTDRDDLQMQTDRYRDTVRDTRRSSPSPHESALAPQAQRAKQQAAAESQRRRVEAQRAAWRRHLEAIGVCGSGQAQEPGNADAG
jgi:hypothetical protein